MTAESLRDERVVILTPTASDAPVTAELLTKAGFGCSIARDMDDLCRMVEEGAAAVIVASEALGSADRFARWLAHQEPWSDLPVLVFTGAGSKVPSSMPRPEALAPFGNVTLLERPVQIITLLSAVRAALRARRRQYAARAVLENLTAAQEELRASDQRKTDFLGVLSHELRNPLAPIRNGVHLLRRAAPGSEQAHRAVAVIQRQTDHLSRIIDDLLDVTRIERGKIELKRAVIDLGTIVRRTCDDHRSIFEHRGLALRVDVAAAAWIDADATRIAQIVGNLLQNAAKFTREEGHVHVSVAVVDERAELRVRDDGVGIAPDLLPQIFTPFVQADASIARTAGGLGLGLALVKGLVELHGGSIRARSDGPGAGAEFAVSLPLATPPAAEHRGVTLRTGNRAAQSLDILVVDDNVDAADTIADLLRLMGHRVHLATSGRAGIEMAQTVRPSVILCDIGLPDIDGYEVARTVRGDAALRSVRLVALSGYARPDDRQRAREAGFDTHLAKPASVDAIVASLSTDAPPVS
jgi:signal transduction histidine kinase/CheY-like chemotaxis protein